MEKITIRYNSDTVITAFVIAMTAALWLIALVGAIFYFKIDGQANIMIVTVPWVGAGITSILVLWGLGVIPIRFVDVIKNGK